MSSKLGEGPECGEGLTGWRKPSWIPGYGCLSVQTWMSAPSPESAPQESAPTLWAPSPARTAMRGTGPAPWAAHVKVRAPSCGSTVSIQGTNLLLCKKEGTGASLST